MRTVAWTIRVAFVAGALLGVTLLAPTTTNAQTPSVTVEIDKVVEGTPPAGTIFQVAYTCEAPDNPNDNFSGTAQFDATGTAVGTHSFVAGMGSHCTITETVDGGATSVSYRCVDIPRGNACTGLGNVLNILNFDGNAVVTVQNDFLPATTTTTTPPVLVQPVFTG